MYVCVCNGVTDSQIRNACALGAHSIECLQKELNVGTCCGRCKEHACKLINSETEQYCLPPTKVGHRIHSGASTPTTLY